MKNPSRTTLIVLLFGIIVSLVLIARTDVMAPVMQFILTTDQGTPLQLIGCIFAAIAGLRLTYILLNMVGKYYSGELEAIEKEKLKLSNPTRR